MGATGPTIIGATTGGAGGNRAEGSQQGAIGTMGAPHTGVTGGTQQTPGAQVNGYAADPKLNTTHTVTKAKRQRMEHS